MRILKHAYRWLFWGYLFVIILLVTLPLNSSGSLNDIKIVSFRADYFFHALLFVPWAFFLPLTSHKQYRWFVYGLMFATAAEAIQYLLPYRAYNINDLLANILGIGLGLLFYNVYMIRN